MKNLIYNFGLSLLIIGISLHSFAQIKTEIEPQMDDLSFLTKAISSNSFEVEAAVLALQKSQNKLVKDFAQMIIEDHTLIGQELEDIVQIKKWELIRINDKELDQGLKDLHASNTSSFDATYTTLMRNSHIQNIELFRLAAQQGSDIIDPAIKQFASNALPTLLNHLDHIKQLEDNIIPKQESQMKSSNQNKTH